MAYNEALAEQIRASLGERPDLSERKMFGGIAFMLNGNMCLGITKDDLMVRVGPEKHDEALTRPGARPMDFTGRPMKGMLYVGPEGYTQTAELEQWIEQSVGFATALPPKQGGSIGKRSKRKTG